MVPDITRNNLDVVHIAIANEVDSKHATHTFSK